MKANRLEGAQNELQNLARF